MAKDLIRRYIWLIDTLDKYGKLSRNEISRLWENSHLGDGNPMPARTFYHHRRSIEDIFHITISSNSRGEYFIEDDAGSPKESKFCRYLLNSFAINETLAETPEVSRHIIVEEIPSSREFLPLVLEGIRKSCKLIFSYHGFDRSLPDRNIRFSPIIVKLYKQRWYMIGIKESIGKVRTYALDRVKDMKLLNEPCDKTSDIDTEEDYFENCLGITQSKAPARNVRLKVTSRQAKYFRALPLHHSQEETMQTSDFSVFTYKLKINYELIHEILSFGSSVEVLAPMELKVQVINELQRSIVNYS